VETAGFMRWLRLARDGPDAVVCVPTTADVRRGGGYRGDAYGTRTFWAKGD